MKNTQHYKGFLLKQTDVINNKNLKVSSHIIAVPDKDRNSKIKSMSFANIDIAKRIIDELIKANIIS